MSTKKRQHQQLKSITLTVTNPEPSNSFVVAFPQGIPRDLDEVDIRVEQWKDGKRKKRMITGELKGVSYVGSNYEEGSSKKIVDVCKYAIGVFDEQTGEIQVTPIDHPYVMRPKIAAHSTAARTTTTMTSYERKSALTDAFGSKKKQRALRAAQSNVISTENISGELLSS